MEVFSANPSAPELPLAGFTASSDPIQIRNIDGIGPVKANIISTQFATGVGELYQGSTIPKRNIVITMGLSPDWQEETVATLRQKLYRYFMPRQWCKLRFFSTHLPTVDIEGYVESMEPNIFSDDPEIQVSVICPKPDFIEADATIYEGVVDDGSTELEFEYIGSVETGFELRVAQSVANPGYSGSLDITVKSPIDPQVFSIDPVTIDGVKYFKLSTTLNGKRAQNIANADGVATNLLAAVGDLSVWPQLLPGLNYISVAAEENGQAWTLAYFNRFGGL